MNHLRRILSLSLLSLLPASRISWVRPASAALAGSQREARFEALMDCFVPADSAPGIVELGLHRDIIEHIEKDQAYLVSLDALLDSLQRLSQKQHAVAFEQASLQQRTDTLMLIFDTARRYERERKLLSSLRTKALTAYYSHEAAFEMLAYHPPSEGGYPDYDRSPV